MKNQVTEIRENLKLTQVEFAVLVDAHPMTVSKWERGKCEPSKFQRKLMEHFPKQPVANIKMILEDNGPIHTLGILFELKKMEAASNITALKTGKK